MRLAHVVFFWIAVGGCGGASSAGPAATTEGRPASRSSATVGPDAGPTAELPAAQTFTTYALRSKAAEVRGNLRALFRGVVTYVSMEDPALPVSPRLPPRLPLTPAVPRCDGQPWPADADQGWSVLGFAPEDPVRFSYEVVVDEPARKFVLRARGDLDCDGTTSTYERAGEINQNGEVEADAELTVRDELE